MLILLVGVMTLVIVKAGQETTQAQNQPVPQQQISSQAASQATSTDDTMERIKAPAFTLTNLAHQPIELSDYKGKVVLLGFWTTY